MSLKKNTLWSIAGGGAPALSALISIPILVLYLGYEQFAIVSLLLSLTIFFYIYDFGVGRSMTYLLPQQRYRESASSNHLLFSAIYLAIVIGGLISAIAYFAASLFVTGWLRVSPEIEMTTINAFQILSIGILPSILGTILRGALEGFSEFKKANIGKIFSGASIFLAPALLVIAGHTNFESISMAILLTRIAALLLFIYLLLQVISLKFVRLSLTDTRCIFEYSKWAALGGFISTMFVYGDRFIVSRYLDSESLSVYIFSQDILIRFLLIPWAMAMVLMPIFAANQLSKEAFLGLYENQSMKVRNYSFLIAVSLILTVYYLLKIPTDVAVSEHVFDVVLIQTIGVFFCAMSQLPLIYLYAKGKPKAVSFIYLSEAALYIMIAPWVFSSFGLTGACLVWAGRQIIEYLLLQIYAKRTMQCS